MRLSRTKKGIRVRMETAVGGYDVYYKFPGTKEEYDGRQNGSLEAALDYLEVLLERLIMGEKGNQ